jgi:hypothetical protein
VSAGTGGNNPVTAFSLAPSTVSVWQSYIPASSPELGSLGPRVAQAGLTATVAGDGFGASPGTVLGGTTAAAVQSWSDSSVSFAIPSVPPGNYSVTVQAGGGTTSNALPLTVLSANQVPVTFTVNDVSLPANASVYLTGNVMELGNNTQTATSAVGPLLAVPGSASSWFLDTSVPAGTQIQFTFFQLLADGTIVPEGVSHSYGVPTGGVGNVSVTW